MSTTEKKQTIAEPASNFTDIFYYSGELRRIAELKGLKEIYTPTDRITKKGDKVYKYEMLKGNKVVFTSNAMQLMNRKNGQLYYAVFKKPEIPEAQPREFNENEKEILALVESPL